jgi:minor extracellular serine protease Vpr
VLVATGDSATFEATITAATEPDPDKGYGPTDFGIYGGYLVLIPDDGGDALRVPFSGFVGDYQRIEHMTDAGFGLPWVSVLIGGNLYQVTGPADWVFSMEGDDVPIFLLHLDHQVEYMETTVYNADSGEPVHPVFNKIDVQQYLPRNDTATGFFIAPWDVSRIHSNGYNGKGYEKNLRKLLPDGNYTVTIKALKANGDMDNPDHWEIWNSPVIAIDRP